MNNVHEHSLSNHFSTPLIRFSALCLTACCTRDVNCSKAKSVIKGQVSYNSSYGCHYGHKQQSIDGSKLSCTKYKHPSVSNQWCDTMHTAHSQRVTHVEPRGHRPVLVVASWYLPFPQARYLDKVPCLHRATCEGHWNATDMTASS